MREPVTVSGNPSIPKLNVRNVPLVDVYVMYCLTIFLIVATGFYAVRPYG